MINNEQLSELLRAISGFIATIFLVVLVVQSLISGNEIPDDVITLLMGLGAFYFVGDSSSAFSAFLKIKKNGEK
ncbi:MAG: hypothetical protein AELANPGJ_03595 [Anaerolineae bacterium]|nr:hypothetical protein [Anaerolineae bacterium]